MISGVIVKELKKLKDHRGWLAELYRVDEIPENLYPAMSYVSLTFPSVERGPHEHKNQIDGFCFFSSTFKLHLWDNRKKSKTFGEEMVFYTGKDNPLVVYIPSGVIHGYKNIGNVPGVVLNFPNTLYAGKNKKKKVDEIRHEDRIIKKYVI